MLLVSAGDYCFNLLIYCFVSDVVFLCGGGAAVAKKC